ncbi:MULTISPECIES: hypothetical protein [Vibrio]|uniref:hypothetical protein n=1 Tax=Vibrio TaxID=662 RepID=UPI0004120CB8|nr:MULTISPECIES: hypothetical protein [Vibrio]
MSKRINSFAPALGESLQSFIFRVLYRAGYSDFSTIVTGSGWGDKPRVPYHARSEFEVIDPEVLFKLYEKCTKVNQTCFSSPFYLIHSFRDTFYPEKQKNYSGQHVQIRYCQDCIEKQLYELGYAYFKAEWLNAGNCLVHSCQLSIVSHGLSRGETIKTIKEILIGKGALERKTDSKIVVEPYTPFSEVDLFFATCAKEAIFNYIFFDEELCPDDYTYLIPTGLLRQENSHHLTWEARRLTLLRNLECYYEMAIEKSYTQMMSYISNTMLVESIFIKGSSKFQLKVAAESCDDCSRIGCKLYYADRHSGRGVVTVINL